MRELKGEEREKAIEWINKHFDAGLDEGHAIFINDEPDEDRVLFKLADGRIFGRYVGDGEESQSITLGCEPKAVFIKPGKTKYEGG